ncbi:MAG: ATP-binding protein [Planctomycetaceae bacterium]
MPSDKFDITIPSEPAAGQQVQDRIIAAMETRGFGAHEVFGMRLALEEGIVNAIKHGNGLDPDKKVMVECEVSEERVTVVIEDEGPGFDPGDVPDPTEEDNLEKPSGRGLMLMRAFMSRVEYHGRGNKVTLEKIRGEEKSE